MARPAGKAGFRPEDGATPGPARVGAALRRAREERGLTLGEIERTLRFTARQLRAVEDGGGPELPPHPYARGVVVAYATLLGLDAETAAQEWGRGPAEVEEPARSVFRVPLRSRSSWRDWAIPLACAGVAAGYLALVPALRPPAIELPEPPSARRAEPGAVALPAPDGPAETADVVPAESGFPVTLRSEGSTWVEVAVDGGESRRLELQPGQMLELRARQRLGLSLGDAGLVRIAVGGRELGFIGDKGEARRGIVFEAPGGSAPAGTAAR